MRIGEFLFTDLFLTLQELEFKTSNQCEEAESLRSELKHVQEELEGIKSQSIALRRDLEEAEEVKSHAEQRMYQEDGRGRTRGKSLNGM